MANILGTIMLQQDHPNSETVITGDIHGLPPNILHGFHIHMFGNLTNGCKDALGHYNPDSKDHGAPNDTVRHVGDLGNIQSDALGHAIVNVTDQHIKLYGDRTVLGRSFVVHEKEDDLGKGGHPDSLITGNAGGRLACCIIGLTGETPISQA
jgi:Cu-Zn family superoxide dismutase